MILLFTHRREKKKKKNENVNAKFSAIQTGTNDCDYFIYGSLITTTNQKKKMCKLFFLTFFIYLYSLVIKIV